MDIDTLYTSDCLQQLKTAQAQSVDLVYMDPPFFSQNIQKSRTRDTCAKKQLLRASATKGCILKILIRTTPYYHTPMFDLEDTDTNLLVVDSHDLIISQWLQEKQGQAAIMLA